MYKVKYALAPEHVSNMFFQQDKHWARSIQTKFKPVRPGKEDHLKRWTSFFETFPVGPNRSIEFWTEISRNFGWMDRAHYNLRSDFPVPRYNTVKYGKHSIRYLGTHIWGKISQELRSKTILQAFRRGVRALNVLGLLDGTCGCCGCSS